MKINGIFYVLLFCAIFSCSKKNSKVQYTYYLNGNIKTCSSLKDGQLNGQTQWFYEDGTLKQVVMFKNNKENGNAYYFYKSGAMESFRHWNNSQMNGYVRDYYDDTVGIIKAVMLFNDKGHVIYKKHFDSIGRTTKVEGERPISP